MNFCANALQQSLYLEIKIFADKKDPAHFTAFELISQGSGPDMIGSSTLKSEHQQGRNKQTEEQTKDQSCSGFQTGVHKLYFPTSKRVQPSSYTT